jgi:hypothetical protein
MAKLDRNRGMFFGSWTGKAITEAAKAVVGASSGITGATVTAAAFGKAVTTSGEYVFTYDSSVDTWKYNSTAVTLSEYGLEVTGDPSNGDTITVTYTAASGGWEALGKDNDELTKELNPDTETTKNVLGETTFTHSGYEPEVDLDPYYMDPSRIMYDHLLECALQEKYGEGDLLGYFAEAFFTSANKEAQTMTGYCYVRRAWFVPQSVGGDTAGYNIPFNVNPIGSMEKKNIVYDMKTNQATITDM